MRLADRVARLGTETAFAMAAKAAAHAAKGNRVFPFHLGDMNLPTPANLVEAANKAIKDGKTGYNPNAGIPELRQALAEDINAARGTGYSLDNVAIQPGGKPVISKFLLALMNPGDEVLYPNPGFPIYESQINFHGGRAVPYGFLPGKSTFNLDFGSLERGLSGKTRLLILNDLHNPTGAECSPEELERVAEFAKLHDLYVLADEAYFDVRYSGTSRSLASYPGMSERTVILYTFSKKFAMTGWRLGAAIGPQEVIDVIVKMNVNEESCTNHFVQYAGLEGLTGDQSGPRGILDILRARRDTAVDILNSIPGVTCYRPEVTFYLYPDVTGAMRAKGFDDHGEFLADVLDKTGVSACARTHFGTPLPGEDRRYLRLAYSGIGVDDIEEGLGRFKAYVESA